MKELTKEEITGLMKSIVWDYDVDPWELYEVVTGKRERAGHFDRERVFVRMLAGMFWYDLLAILGMDYMKKYLNESAIQKIWYPELREKYELARKILQGEPVPLSGWDPENRERIKSTLLSHRWYRAEPSLLQP